MEVCPELVISGDIGLDQSLPCAQIVALGLAHKGLGNSWDRSFALDCPVGIYICNFSIAKTKNINCPVSVIDVAGNLPTHNFEPISVKAEGKTAEAGKVGDEVARRVVGGAQHIGEGLPLHIEIYDDILFFIQIEMSEN